MKLSLLILTAFLVLNLPLMAQKSGMEQLLNTGTNEERLQKFVSLGLEREAAELAVGGKVEWRLIHNESQHEIAIMFQPCSAPSASYLYLLEGADFSWHVTDKESFDCHYDESVSFQVAALQSPDVDDVLVHHECVGHGTGFVQQNFNVFAVVSSKFKLVLDTQEVLKAFNDYKRDERSSFFTIPATKSISGLIVETRRTYENGRLTIQKRKFRWSPAKFSFLPSQFVSVEPRR